MNAAHSFPRFRFPKGSQWLYDEKEWAVDERRGGYVLFKQIGGDGFQRWTDRDLRQLTRSGALRQIRKADVGKSPAEIIAAQQTDIPGSLEPAVQRMLGYIKCLEGVRPGRSEGKSVEERIKEEAERQGDPNPPNRRTVEINRTILEDWGGDPRGLTIRRSKRRFRKKKLAVLLRKKMREFLVRYYLNEDRLSLLIVYGYLVKEVERLQDEAPSDWNSVTLPHYTTFLRFLNEHFTLYQQTLARYGKKAARAIRMDKDAPQPEHPMDRIYIDSTQVDTLWRDERGKVRKRLTLTLVICAFTHMVLGFYLGPEPPSWFTVSEAFRNAVLPKDWVEKLFPGKTTTPWLAEGLGRGVRLDQGAEHHNSYSPLAFAAVGMDVHFAPAGCPWVRGISEPFFDIANESVFHLAPATTRSNPKDRGAEDPTKRAAREALTLPELYEWFVCWVVDIYHNKEQEGLQFRSPLQMWEDGWKDCDLEVGPVPAEDDLLILFGKTKKRRIQRKGIKFRWLKYRSEELNDYLAHVGLGAVVEFKYDPGDLSRIWVRDMRHGPHSNEFILASIEEENREYATGLTEWQHMYVLSKLRRERRKQRPTSQDLAARLAALRQRFVTAEIRPNRVFRERPMTPTPRMPSNARPNPVAEMSPQAARKLWDRDRYTAIDEAPPLSTIAETVLALPAPPADDQVPPVSSPATAPAGDREDELDAFMRGMQVDRVNRAAIDRISKDREAR